MDRMRQPSLRKEMATSDSAVGCRLDRAGCQLELLRGAETRTIARAPLMIGRYLGDRAADRFAGEERHASLPDDVSHSADRMRQPSLGKLN